MTHPFVESTLCLCLFLYHSRLRDNILLLISFSNVASLARKREVKKRRNRAMSNVLRID